MKIQVVGIDGASPALLQKWRQHLPSLRRLSEKGTTGPTIPPIPQHMDGKPLLS